MVPLRTLVVTVMGLGLLVLAALVWRQQGEIRELRVAASRSAMADPAIGGTIEEATGATLHAIQEAPERRPVAKVERPRIPTPADRAQIAADVETLMQDPGFVRAMLSQHRAMLEDRFAPLFRQLALSQAEVAELRMLLAEKHQAAIDVLMVARDESLGHLEGGDIRRAAARARDEIDQMILSTLGQDRYAIFKEFENSLPHRATVEQLERRLSYTEAPMAPEQVEAMVNVLATVGGEPAPARPGVSVVVNESDPQVVPLLQSTEPASRITEEVVQLATNVLQPPQVQVLRELQREQELNTWAMWSGSPGGGGARSGASATASSTVFDQDSLLGGIEIQLLLQ